MTRATPGLLRLLLGAYKRQLGGICLLALASVEAADAQRRGRGFERDRDRTTAGWIGVHFITADPVGEFGQLVDVGFGVELSGNLPMAAQGALSMKLDAGIVVYGHERAHVCFNPPIGCRRLRNMVTPRIINERRAGARQKSSVASRSREAVSAISSSSSVSLAAS